MYKGELSVVIDSVLGLLDPKARAYVDDLARDYEANNGHTFHLDLSVLEEHLDDYPEHTEAIEALKGFMREAKISEVSIYYWW
jgi:hypothetical protein